MMCGRKSDLGGSNVFLGQSPQNLPFSGEALVSTIEPREEIGGKMSWSIIFPAGVKMTTLIRNKYLPKIRRNKTLEGDILDHKITAKKPGKLKKNPHKYIQTSKPTTLAKRDGAGKWSYRGKKKNHIKTPNTHFVQEFNVEGFVYVWYFNNF